MLASGQYRIPATLTSQEQPPSIINSVCPRAGLHETEGKKILAPPTGSRPPVVNSVRSLPKAVLTTEIIRK